MTFAEKPDKQAVREAAVSDMRPILRERVELDASIHGNGYAEKMGDGCWRRIDPTKIAIFMCKREGKAFGKPRFLPVDPVATLTRDLQSAMNRVHLLEGIILKLASAQEVSLNLSEEEYREVNLLVEDRAFDEAELEQ